MEREWNQNVTSGTKMEPKWNENIQLYRNYFLKKGPHELPSKGAQISSHDSQTVFALRGSHGVAIVPGISPTLWSGSAAESPGKVPWMGPKLLDFYKNVWILAKSQILKNCFPLDWTQTP